MLNFIEKSWFFFVSDLLANIYIFEGLIVIKGLILLIFFKLM